MDSQEHAQTLAELARLQSQSYGDKVALVFGERETTYAEFDSRTSRAANALIGDGIEPQDRVAVIDKDSDRCYEVLFGSAKANAVTLGVNWRLAPPEVTYIINDAQAKILFVGEEFFQKIESIRDRLASVKKIIALSGRHPQWPSYEEWLAAHNDSDPHLPSRREDIVIQMYTSGTTGHPKGVQLANYSFFAIADELEKIGERWLEWDDDDVSLLNIPSFHIGGVWWAIRGIAAGSKNVVMDAFVAWKALDYIRRYRVSKICLVPAMIQVILVEPTCNENDFSSLKHIGYGGSPIPLSLLQQAMVTFKCQFRQMYGMTETGNVAVSLPPEDHSPACHPRMLAAGKPLPGVEVRIINAEGDTLPPETMGEICIKSPANMIGYWNMAEATARTLVNGWIRTGDAGYMDADGYVYIRDRVKDMIIYAGENVYPAEVESAMFGHEAVAEVAVIGIPDPRWGETIKAFVVLKPEAAATARELIAYTRQHIADFKVPKSVEFVASLPRTPSGKLRKEELRAPYWRGHQRKVN